MYYRHCQADVQDEANQDSPLDPMFIPFKIPIIKRLKATLFVRFPQTPFLYELSLHILNLNTREFKASSNPPAAGIATR
jgi:hypothetical protein